MIKIHSFTSGTNIYVNEIEHEHPSWNIAPNSDMVVIRANNSTAETVFHLRRRKKMHKTRLVNELVDFNHPNFEVVF